MNKINKKAISKIVVILLVAVATFTVMGCSAKKSMTTEEISFGLQDYEGYYCRTETEEIEDNEVTYTYGYQFNGDGTGVYYGQDVIDFTWNETEIHFADSTELYIMEPGKLTVRNIEYSKVEANPFK